MRPQQPKDVVASGVEEQIQQDVVGSEPHDRARSRGERLPSMVSSGTSSAISVSRHGRRLLDCASMALSRAAKQMAVDGRVCTVSL